MKTIPLRTYLLLCILAASLICTPLSAALTPTHRTPTAPLFDDITAPVTVCTLDGIIQLDIYISNVTVTLNATDDISGVNATYYSIDSGNLFVYTTPFLICGNGDHTVTYYSIDNAGNIEEPKMANFTIILASAVAISIIGGLGPVASITNIGTEDLIDTPFCISLDNGYYLVGAYRNGTCTIHVGETIVLRSFVVGLGEPTLKVRVGRTEASIQAFVFGPLVIRLT
jgi:hypothetical protein